MRLFVTGASGFIGRHFCAMATAAGHEVLALVRTGSLKKLTPGVKPIIGSLPYDVPHQAIKNADAIIHLAAITTADRAGESFAVNQLGTENLLRLAHGHCPRILFLSTQSAHTGNTSAYAVTKLASEQALRASSLQYAIVRPGLVYGPGETGLFARMRQALRRLPIVPMLGGGQALVQPVHVDDLCRGLITIIENFDQFTSAELLVGAPEDISLAQFLTRVARAEGRPARQLPVPLGPVKLAVSTAEKLRLPLPISSDNIKGLETVQRMDTAPSLERLNLQLRDLDKGLRQSLEDPPPATSDPRIPVLLMGAGKIGIVHGLQLRHSARLRLAGIVEPNQKARKLYRSMGFNAPFFTTLQEAVSDKTTAPQAAIIATPAHTHLSIARQCLAAGLHILTEKPASISDEGENTWRDLHDEFPRQVIHCGYMAAQFPQLFTAFRLVRMNKLGPLVRARLVALQTHITASRPVRWEMLRDKSGGGAAINFGCHVASMLFRLAGWPDPDTRGWQWPIYSTEVEDAIVAQFSVRGIPCSLAISWSVPGYARPYSLVELECDQGTIRVENASITIIQDDNIQQFKTQLDYPLPFNLAPDYTGGGFALEHEAFASAVQAAQAGRSWSARQTDYMPAVELPEALRLENWIRNLYQHLPMKKPGRGEIMSLGISADIAELLIAAGESQP